MRPYLEAQQLINKFDTSDPFEICDQLGIHIVYCELPKRIEGFFQNIHDQFVIYINSLIDEYKIDNVVAHELGHIMMHAELNVLFLKENSYMNINKYEREANIFSAYLNIDKYEYDIDMSRICSLLEVDIDIVEKIIKYKMQCKW